MKRDVLTDFPKRNQGDDKRDEAPPKLNPSNMQNKDGEKYEQAGFAENLIDTILQEDKTINVEFSGEITSSTPELTSLDPDLRVQRDKRNRKLMRKLN